MNYGFNLILYFVVLINDWNHRQTVGSFFDEWNTDLVFKGIHICAVIGKNFERSFSSSSSLQLIIDDIQMMSN
jgi:hypothetical protein